MKKQDTEAVSNRRGNLELFIERKYLGKQALLISDVHTRTGVELNQGELSGLLGAKSFGEKKARSLEKLLDLPFGALDTPVGGVFENTSFAQPKMEGMLKSLAIKVANEDDLRILMQVILEQDPPEIPEHIRESVKSMVQTLRNLIQQSSNKNKQ